MSSDGDEAAAASKRPLRFMDLPLETQNDIIDHVSVLFDVYALNVSNMFRISVRKAN